MFSPSYYPVENFALSPFTPIGKNPAKKGCEQLYLSGSKKLLFTPMR